MKNKSAVLFALGLALMLSGGAYAASGVRGAKSAVTFVSTTPQTITKSPSAVYSVVLGTGAVTDYVVLFDSANATAAVVTQNSGNFRGKYYPSSATANTQITFDPPLQFANGITAVSATSLVPTTVVYEIGRVNSGY